MSTPTPRTSSAIIASGFQAVPEGFRAFAGILERELTALTAERDKLRAQNDQFSDNLSAVGAVYNAEKARAERAEAEAERYRLVTLRLDAELAKERARLDSGQILLTVAGERVWHCRVDLRAAIDAAMKEETK